MYRNSVSMTENMPYKKKGDYLLKGRSSFEQFEQNVYVDAHHINRRKSCYCACCGGIDNMAIKKMNKQAMDLLKEGISP